ncbi:antitoxin Xre/MbcA/ParS toxin-binding domain-containing protein [Parasedimentitalea maritima]|uniref:DUF2384 domain-containing protein n=1 Tax=Parasedimentitalea maritima TaxID=2578117 RepID=A0A6A4RC95_9RHOB|nr:antitoxin Xre/MbcA/ParS toxin-binding domain-containing protein [Zongyanglinia marina]KAE9625092.1 DUF2384 domain-containing protein [Zongyanglinia marina]
MKQKSARSKGDTRATASATDKENDLVPKAYNLLGGEQLLDKPVGNAFEAHDLILRGIPTKAFVHLAHQLGPLASEDAVFRATGVSLCFIERDAKAGNREGRLSVVQSKNAWQLAVILALGVDVFGDQESTCAWMLSPAIALDNRCPIDLICTAPGATAVEVLIKRIEYGVYI